VTGVRPAPPGTREFCVRFRPLTLLLALLVLGAMAAAPPAHGGAQPLPSSRLSFLHLSADAPALDVYLDGGRAISSLNFSETSAYIGLSAGAHHLQITGAGRLDILLSSNIATQPGASYTWVLSGLITVADSAAPASPDILFAHLLQLSDNAGESAEPRPRLRVVNASPGAGGLDVRLDGPGDLLATTLPYGGIGGYALLNDGTYTVDVFRTGVTTPVATIPGVALQTGNAYTLVLGGLLPNAIPANPPNPVQGFQAVKLTDQNMQRSQTLTRGCNQVILPLPVGSQVVNVLQRMQDPSTLTSIWRFDNGLKLLRAGFFNEPNAPVDYTVTRSSPEAAFFCVSNTTSWDPA